MFHERPQPVAVRVQFETHSSESLITTELAAQQQAVDGLAHRLHLGSECLPRDLTGLVPVPDQKHDFNLPPQVVTQSFDLIIVMINQRLPLSFSTTALFR